MNASNSDPPFPLHLPPPPLPFTPTPTHAPSTLQKIVLNEIASCSLLSPRAVCRVALSVEIADGGSGVVFPTLHVAHCLATAIVLVRHFRFSVTPLTLPTANLHCHSLFLILQIKTALPGCSALSCFVLVCVRTRVCACVRVYRRV